jgi:thiosulfate/3-mercaptopyruvate sulfurtransferase
MPYANPDALASTEWLSEHLHDADVVVFDGTSHVVPTRDADAEFAEKHIPGARRFDINDIADPDDPLAHMLPSPELFAQKVGALGVSNTTRVIVYDVYGLQSAARVWWMFRVFGHDNVAVLNGGLPCWEKRGNPVTDAPPSPRATGNFTSKFRPELVRNRHDLLKNIESQAEQVADARANGRFKGTDPEPRAGMRSGHIPGSVSLPFTQLLGPDKMLLPSEDIRSIIDAASVDLTKPLVTSCGSGVTACVLALGCHLLGKDDVAIYDGSWSEWGGRDDTPVQQGE